MACRSDYPVQFTGVSDTVRTVVIQSYRTTDVAPWLQRCMQTVQAWTEANGYAYEFVDDTLFDYVPAHLRQKPYTSLLPLTDLARLGLLRSRLASTYERAIWMDADVVVFRPGQLTIPSDCGAMLCHEIWSSFDAQGQMTHRRGINNAVMIFDRGHPLLDFLYYATTELYAHHDTDTIPPTALGTAFLSKLGKLIPMRLLTQVACLSPVLTRALFDGNRPDLLRAHAEHYGHAFHAANLCRSMSADETSGPNHHEKLSSTQLLQTVEMLISTEGQGHTLRPIYDGPITPAGHV